VEPRRCSVAGIAAEGGKFFAARRVSGGDLGGKWEFPGGKVEEGESCEEALIREFREELGITVKVGPLLGTARFTHRGQNRVLKAYRVFFPLAAFTLSVHSEYRWVTAAEIRELDFADSDLRLLPALEAYFQEESPVEGPVSGAPGGGGS
jgi:8-oxo-dGTP diphosphatase